MAAPYGIFAGFLRQFCRVLVSAFYSRIAVSNPSRLRGDGPVILAANHANSLFDPVVLGIAARRPIHFFAKAPLFEIPVLGPLLTAAGMIPVYRGVDGPSALERNFESFVTGAGLLKHGGTIGIFPEGKSHDAMKLESVRSGVSRLSLETLKQGVEELRIIPVGINYETKHRFQTAVWVEAGEPIIVRALPSSQQEEKRWLRLVTDQISAGLKGVMIHVEKPEWQEYLPTLQQLLCGDLQDTVEKLRARKVIGDWLNSFVRENPDQAAENFEALRNLKQDYGDSLFFCLPGKLRTVLLRCWYLLVGLLPAAIGLIFNLIPFALVRLIAFLIPRKGRMTIGLTRLALGLPLYGAWYFLAGNWLLQYFVPWYGFLVLMLGAFCGLYAIRYWPSTREDFPLLIDSARLRFNSQRWNEFQSRVATVKASFPFTPASKPVSDLAKGKGFVWFSKRMLVRIASIALGFLLLGTLFLLVSGSLRMRESLWEKRGKDLPHGGELIERLVADQQMIANAWIQMPVVLTQARQLGDDFREGRRSLYNQADDDYLRGFMLQFLGLRQACLETIASYAESELSETVEVRNQVFVTAVASGVVLYRLTEGLIAAFGRDPAMVRKLNEPEPVWSIPPGLYDAVKTGWLNAEARLQLEAALLTFRSEGRTNFVVGGRFTASQTLADAVESLDTKVLAAGAQNQDRWNIILKRSLQRVKGKQYHFQSIVSRWVGSTRIREPRRGRPLIQPQSLVEIRKMLKPGDILLERQNWYVSRALMPGFWAHAALYVGNMSDLRRLAVTEHPWVAQHLEAFEKKNSAGHDYCILEAVPEGVRMTTLEHCLGVADSAAVLRPKLTPEQNADVIARAFSHLGKPYDFEFDFFTTDKLVCTELVYRACNPDITFPLVEVLGRKTIPPTEMARKFVQERKSDGRELDFVLFYDGSEKKGFAEPRGEEDFCTTVNRPALTWFQPRE